MYNITNERIYISKLLENDRFNVSLEIIAISQNNSRPPVNRAVLFLRSFLPMQLNFILALAYFLSYSNSKK